jgi:hypothetical protein
MNRIIAMVVMPWIAAASTLSVGVATIQPTVAQPAPRLDLRCSRSAQDFSLELSLHNEADSAAALVLGLALANGRVYLPTALTLLRATLDKSGDEQFDYSHPAYGFISGRVDPWVVPLPPGAKYSLSIPAAHFVSKEHFERFANNEDERDVRLVLHGRPIVQPNLDMPGLRLLSVWTGQVTSNSVKLPSACRSEGDQKSTLPSAWGRPATNKAEVGWG